MSSLILTIIFIGNLTVTSYRSVPEQTDQTPYITSTGERVHKYGIAVSQDLLKKNGGPLEYGDMVYVDRLGWKIVNDCMNIRHRNRMDVWVPDLKSEKEFDQKYRNTKFKIFVIRRKVSETK